MLRLVLITAYRGAILLSLCGAARADIFRWDNGDLIPGTEGITLAPGVQLDGLELGFANLEVKQLADASFRSTNLNRARLDRATLTNADFTDAEILGASFNFATRYGFTKEQLYSTASYQEKNLSGTSLWFNDFSDGDFRDIDLRLARLMGANLTGADLSGADLTDAFLNSTMLENANLTGADIVGASFAQTTTGGFTKEQLYGTASYQNKTLQGVQLYENDLSGWDFSGQNMESGSLFGSTLTSANFAGAKLQSVTLASAQLDGADFAGAEIAGVGFSGVRGFAKEQLYSTANYGRKDLSGIDLRSIDLSGWDFSGINLTGARFDGSTLTGAIFADAEVEGARFDSIGFAKEQLYSTANYLRQELHGLVIRGNLTGWDFSSQDLNGTTLSGSGLRDAMFVGADLTNVILSDTDIAGASFVGSNLSREQLYATKSYGDQLLERVNFSEHDLTDWDFRDQRLTNSDFTDANIEGALFVGSTLTKEQLYSTRSYQENRLERLQLGTHDMSDWDLSGQNLEAARFEEATLAGANLANARLRLATFDSADVAGANFADAVIDNAVFANSSLSKEQLYSTANYKAKDLQGVVLAENDLTGWDLSGQNLSRADLDFTVLAGVDLSDAVIDYARFKATTADGLTREQIYSTANYQQKNLSGVDLSDNVLADWDLSGQNLSDAKFNSAELTQTNFADAVIAGAQFNITVRRGFTKDQLYSTASYQAGDLRRVWLRSNDLTDWDFSGQDLRGADFTFSTLEGADFSRADLRGVTGLDLHETTILRNSIDPNSIVIDLNLQADETLVAGPGGFLGLPVAIFGKFAIAATGKLDLTDNSAIVYEAPASAVRAQLIAGRGGAGLGGAWTGNGITSSTAAAANGEVADSRSIGYAENGTLPLGSYEEFHGFPVLPESVLVAYTRTGDANLDGVVNDDDVTIVGAFYAPGVPNPHWALGDFDYNGFVDDDDVTLLGALYDPAAAPLVSPPAEPGAEGSAGGVAAVPEPSTVVMIMVFAACTALMRCVGRLPASRGSLPPPRKKKGILSSVDGNRRPLVAGPGAGLNGDSPRTSTGVR